MNGTCEFYVMPAVDPRLAESFWTREQIRTEEQEICLETLFKGHYGGGTFITL